MVDGELLKLFELCEAEAKERRESLVNPPRRTFRLSPSSIHGHLCSFIELSDNFRAIARFGCRYRADEGHKVGEETCEWATRNFFKRSRFYDAVANGKKLDLSELSRNFLDELVRKSIKVTYLVPINAVSFSKDSIDCGGFRIKKYTEHDLHEILECDTRLNYYKKGPIPIDTLSGFHFIEVDVVKDYDCPYLCSFMDDVDLGNFGVLNLEYTELPSKIEDALELIALFDWEAHCDFIDEKRNDSYWTRPDVPFVLRIDDRLLEPMQPSRIKGLFTRPVYDPRTDDLGDREEPEIVFYLDANATSKFEEKIHFLYEAFFDLERASEKWSFLFRAKRFLFKAFITRGAESLIWYAATLEALFGPGAQDRDPITSTLKRRAATILAADSDGRKKYSKLVGELYDCRSSLVHDRDKTSQMYYKHITQARRVCRSSVCRFAYWLHGVWKAIGNGSRLPSRDYLLDLIDLYSHADHGTLNTTILEPNGFPNVPGWN